MTTDFSQTIRPIAIPIKDFRDGEIVDFFANENRTFQATAPDGDFGRSRLVGMPHFVAERKAEHRAEHKGNVALRVSFRTGSQPEVDAPRSEILWEKSANSIPIPSDILSINSEVIAATITEIPKKKHSKTIEPSFVKPAQPLASVLIKERKKNVLKESSSTKILLNNEPVEVKKPVPDSIIEKVENRLRETDEQLSQLIENWPKMSTELKTRISSLLNSTESSES